MTRGFEDDAYYPMPGGYGKTPAERLDALSSFFILPTEVEVSTHGRVRKGGKLLNLERHGKFGRVKINGKRHDVASLVRRVVHSPSGKPDWCDQVIFPRTNDLKYELWFSVEDSCLV